MHKMHFRQNLIDPFAQKLVFQQKNNSKNNKNILNHRSKSKKQKKLYLEKHLNQKIIGNQSKIGSEHTNKLIPSMQPVFDEKIILQHEIKMNQIQHNELLNNQIQQGSMCINHPKKKGQYILRSDPQVKVCLKCNIALSQNDENIFINKNKFTKKEILQNFKEKLANFKTCLQQEHNDLRHTIQTDQDKFNQHSAYISQSFGNLINKIQEKKRQLINNLILAQQTLKKQYEDNFKNIQKVKRSIGKYQIDIEKNYDDIINDLPLGQFDQIMKQYNQKLQNYKQKVKRMIIREGICVYIPNIQLQKLLNRSSVEYYKHVKQNEFSKTKNKIVSHSFDHKFFQKNRPSSKTKDLMNTTDYIKNLNLNNFDKENINIENIRIGKNAGLTNQMTQETVA